MTSLDLALDIVQFAVLFVLSVANGLIAYSVFKIQKDRNTPKLVVYMELVEGEEREYAGLYIQNVGLAPALNVRIVADIEEWREGQPSGPDSMRDTRRLRTIMLRSSHKIIGCMNCHEWKDGR